MTVDAEQSPVTRNWKVMSVGGSTAAAEKQMTQADGSAITGEVRQVDSEANSIVLFATGPSGQAGNMTIVWDNGLKQQMKLENAKVGDQLSILANQNMVTRNWKVVSIA
ncbi:MAG: hypothetical protein KBD07_01835 [Candidatus Omnitrophica bacterium]|nr:hypothetical protein [Candidatus Omnitrophota bacterium]